MCVSLMHLKPLTLGKQVHASFPCVVSIFFKLCSISFWIHFGTLEFKRTEDLLCPNIGILSWCVIKECQLENRKIEKFWCL